VFTQGDHARGANKLRTQFSEPVVVSGYQDLYSRLLATVH